MTHIVVVTAGLSDPSTTRLLGERIAESLAGKVDDPQVESVALREHAHAITDATLTGFAAPGLQAVYDRLADADAVVWVTPVFKASYTGLFKSFLDAMEPEILIGKPVLLAATGGTARHSLVIDTALRPLFAYLQTFTVPTGVFASPHDWGSDGAQALAARIDRATSELASILAGGGTGRAHSDEIDLFSDTMRSIAGG